MNPNPDQQEKTEGQKERSFPHKIIAGAIALVIAAILAGVAVYYAAPFDQGALLSRSTFRSLEWGNERAVHRITADWPEFTGDQSGENALENRTVLKETKEIIGPFLFDASLRRLHDSGRHEISYHISLNNNDFDATPDNFEFCNRYKKQLVDALGEPVKHINLSKGDISTDYATINQDTQWDIGETRIVLNCFAMKVYDGYIPLKFIHIGDQRDVAALQDPIFLTCDHQYKFVGQIRDKGVEQDIPINIMINPNTKSISSSTHNLGKTVSYDDRKIVSKNETDSLNTVFVLDRVMGNYTWQTRLKEDEDTGANRWGECRHVESDHKF